MEIKFQHCTVLQKGNAVIFYNYNRELEGYFITGIIVAKDMTAKLHLASLIKYFFTEIVRNKDVYCSLFDDESDFFNGHITKHSEINGMQVYKINSYGKDVR